MDKFNSEVINKPLANIVGECFARYAKYIIQDRALPDIRDGLKPVQRRILYAMNELGLNYDKPYKKSARTVGEVIGKYHPHGDSSIYEAMVRMSQNWKNNIPLLDMHGNNGSIDGDSAAAMRYTECRLSRVANLMLDNIKSDTVDFALNFDDSEKEPTILPSLFPNLLINGAVGIAAGYATNIPTFNPNEVFDCAIELINNENLTIEDILKIVPGPDFPTGAIIENKQGIVDFYNTGKGKFFITSKFEIINDSKLNQIIITEIPYDTNKSQIVKEINDIIFDEKISGIISVKDLSDKDGIRIVIDCKKDKNISTIKNYLFKNTHLQINYSANFVAIVNRKPKLLNILDVFKNYLEYALLIQLRIAEFDLKKANQRYEIVKGLIIATNHISEVIEIIRSSDSKQNAEENLINRFCFTKIQAEAITNLRLYRLSKTDITQFLDEASRLEHYINELQLLINSQDLQKISLKQKLLEYKKQFGYDRKTQISNQISDLNVDVMETIEIQKVYLFASRDGYLKTISDKTFESNSFSEIGHNKYDFVFYAKKCMNNEILLVVTKFGKVIQIPIYKIKTYRWKEIGEFIGNFVSFSPSDKIIYCDIISSNVDNKELFFITKFGYCKRTNLSEFNISPQSKQVLGIKLKQDDELINSCLIDSNEKYLISLTNNNVKGYSFDIGDVPILQRSASGIKTMKLKDDEFLLSSILSKDLDSECCLVFQDEIFTISMKKFVTLNRNSSGKQLLKCENKHLINVFAINKSSVLTYMNHDNTFAELIIANYKITRERIIFDILDASINLAYSNNRYNDLPNTGIFENIK